MKPILLTTAMLFALTPLTAASLTWTDTSNWNGYYRDDPLTAGTYVSGTTSFCVNGCFGPHAVYIDIHARPVLRYGYLDVDVYANSSSPDGIPSGLRPDRSGYFPRYELNHVEGSGTAAFTDALTLFTGGLGAGSITFQIFFHGYVRADAAGGYGTFTAGGLTVVKNGPGGDVIPTITIPFTDGIPIPISGFLRADAYDMVPNDGNLGASGATPSVIVQSIQVFDPAGIQLNRYSYGAESNALYPFVGGTAVPEPGSFALMGIGAMTLCRWRVVKKASI